MINMKKTAIATSLLLVAGAANAAPLSSLELTGGNFAMAGAGGVINPAAFANMSVDGSYDGSAPAITGTEASYSATSIGTFAFGFFGPVAIYTQSTDSAGVGPFPGVTGDITGGALSLDLSSWTAWWNGTDFNMGPGTRCVTVTATNCSTPLSIDSFNAATGDFTASWDSVVVGGAFNGQLASWAITGNASAVPVPAAAWLFGSGLLGLVGVARRRKAA